MSWRRIALTILGFIFGIVLTFSFYSHRRQGQIFKVNPSHENTLHAHKPNRDFKNASMSHPVNSSDLPIENHGPEVIVTRKNVGTQQQNVQIGNHGPGVKVARKDVETQQQNLQSPDDYEEYFEDWNDELDIPYINPKDLKWGEIEEANVFLPFIIAALEAASLQQGAPGVRNTKFVWDNIVLFTGQSVKRIFDPKPVLKKMRADDSATEAAVEEAYPVEAHSLLDNYLTSILHQVPHPKDAAGTAVTGYTDSDLYPHFKHIVAKYGRRTRRWSDVQKMARMAHKYNLEVLANSTGDQLPAIAVRLHKEDTLGTFLEHIVADLKGKGSRDNKLNAKEHRAQYSAGSSTQSAAAPTTLRDEIWNVMDDGGLKGKSPHAHVASAYVPLVITNSVDENWGSLSTRIHTRTGNWLNLTNHLKLHGVSYEFARHFLTHPSVLLWVTNAHVDPNIVTSGADRYNHNWMYSHNRRDYIAASISESGRIMPEVLSKILCLPLGVKAKRPIYLSIREYSEKKVNKTRILQINNSGWGDRTAINDQISRAFNYTVWNTYNGGVPSPRLGADKGKQTRRSRKRSGMNSEARATVGALSNRRRLSKGFNHKLEAVQARFALCPSGLGFDSYRLWETLLVGTVPIVESNIGMDRTYSTLPVLVVRNFSLVTPQLLRISYPCFVEHAPKWNYPALTMQYWLHMIDEAVNTANISHITANHPFRNKYCDFLDFVEEPPPPE